MNKENLCPTLRANKVCAGVVEMEKLIIDTSMSGLDGGAVRVYEQVAPSITAREYKEPRMVLESKIQRLGGIYGNHQLGSVYSQEGISPTLDAAEGGGITRL